MSAEFDVGGVKVEIEKLRPRVGEMLVVRYEYGRERSLRVVLDALGRELEKIAPRGVRVVMLPRGIEMKFEALEAVIAELEKERRARRWGFDGTKRA